MPFEEVPHTADWCLRVRAASLDELFIEAARGMNALAGTRPARGPRTKRTFTCEAQDHESLLVSFLSELLYLGEQEKLAFDEFQLAMSGDHLDASVTGAPMRSTGKIIKAVTYHNLQIQRTEAGYEVEIVFDV